MSRDAPPPEATESRPKWSRWLHAWRSPAALVVLLAGTAAIWLTVNQHFPLRHWYLGRIALYWGLVLYFSAGCFSLGFGVVSWLGRGQLRIGERMAIAFPVGLLGFSLAFFALGLMGALNVTTFVALPLGCVISGLRPLARFLVRVERHRLHRLPPLRLSPIGLLAILLATLGLAAVYIPILTLENIQYDAFWYHLPIAQQYASSGAITRFDEGWFLGAYPHLSSLVYSWAMLWPANVFNRLELCAHLEFAIFLFTLMAIGPLVRSLVGRRVPLAWVGMFLFPGFLVYDATLSTGADHVAAVWAGASLIVLLRLLRGPDWRNATLLAALTGGAALTKYSAICIIAPTLLCAGAWTLLRVRRAPPGAKRRWRWQPRPVALLALVGVFAAVWAPHWLKNWVWYGDPLYPALHRYLDVELWNPEVQFHLSRWMDEAWERPAAGLAGVLDTVWVALTLGFEVNEYEFHGSYPTFGFLFPVTLIASLLLPVRWRVRLCFALCSVGVAVWYATNHHDRYLQAMVPWLVVPTLSVLVIAWQTGSRWRRGALGVLVATQLLCSVDNWFLSAHRLSIGHHPLVPLLDSVRAGMQEHYQDRFRPIRDSALGVWTDIGRKLRKQDAKVLIHEERFWVGLNQPVVCDQAGWQGGLAYGHYANASEVYQALKNLGVTHVVIGGREGDAGYHSLAGELVFRELMHHHSCRKAERGPLTLWELPSQPPEPRRPGDVLVLTCDKTPPAGFYDLSQLRSVSSPPGEPKHRIQDVANAPKELIAQAMFAVTDEDCAESLVGQLRGYRRIGKRKPISYWMNPRRFRHGPKACEDDPELVKKKNDRRK